MMCMYSKIQQGSVTTLHIYCQKSRHDISASRFWWIVTIVCSCITLVSIKQYCQVCSNSTDFCSTPIGMHDYFDVLLQRHLSLGETQANCAIQRKRSCMIKQTWQEQIAKLACMVIAVGVVCPSSSTSKNSGSGAAKVCHLCANSTRQVPA